jgi:hypothetical protein
MPRELRHNMTPIWCGRPQIRRRIRPTNAALIRPFAASVLANGFNAPQCCAVAGGRRLSPSRRPFALVGRMTLRRESKKEPQKFSTAALNECFHPAPFGDGGRGPYWMVAKQFTCSHHTGRSCSRHRNNKCYAALRCWNRIGRAYAERLRRKRALHEQQTAAAG